MKTKLDPIWITIIIFFATIGCLDFFLQIFTDGEFRLIHRILFAIFSK